MRLRVFKIEHVLSDMLIFIPENVKFKDINSDFTINLIKKENFIGIYEFDEKFIFLLNKKVINNIITYYIGIEIKDTKN